MNYILFDDASGIKLLPLTYTRPVADIRIGILTIRQKWEHFLEERTSSFTSDYLSVKYPISLKSENVFINGSVIPDGDLIKEIDQLSAGHKLVCNGIVVAAKMTEEHFLTNLKKAEGKEGYKEQLFFERIDLPATSIDSDVFSIEYTSDIFSKNGVAISKDFELLKENKKSASISSTNQVLGDQIFIEEGAKVECAIINTNSGPVYIGKNAEVMEGSIIRGPFALCDHSTLKMGAKIYGPTTIGPFCKVGGEVSNSVFMSYSNKGHDGFLGNSVIGEWCNLGADTNSSNLKNNYGKVKIWSYAELKMIQSDLQFCGLVMGDHSKSGINTMFNTATTVGVSSNIYGGEFPPKFVPSFSWGGHPNWVDFQLEKAFEVSQKMMERRNIAFTEMDEAIFRHIFKITSGFRSKLAK